MQNVPKRLYLAVSADSLYASRHNDWSIIKVRNIKTSLLKYSNIFDKLFLFKFMKFFIIWAKTTKTKPNHLTSKPVAESEGKTPNSPYFQLPKMFMLRNDECYISYLFIN